MSGVTDITIDKMGLEGQGVGSDSEGNIYFVPGVIVGDRVRVRYDEKQKRYRDILLSELIEPSPSRVEPPCPYFQDCGGCDWLHWDYKEQLRAKSQIVTHVLARGNIQPQELRPILGAEQTLGYRNRIQVRKEGSQVGFYRKKSHEIVDVEACAVTHPRLNEALRELRASGQAESRHKYEMFLNTEGGITTVRDRQHAAGGFSQVHDGQNEKLKRLVASLVEEGQAKTVLELFSGAGNLTYAYAARVDRVIAIDSDPRSIASAISLRPPELAKRLAFFAMQVTPRLVRNLPPDFQNSYDTLIVDPPRLGVGDFIGRFVHPGLRRIIYVSCSPVSFSQDAQCLLKDFSLETVQPIDMFPHTRHIELVAVFQRRPSSLS